MWNTSLPEEQLTSVCEGDGAISLHILGRKKTQLYFHPNNGFKYVPHKAKFRLKMIFNQSEIVKTINKTQPSMCLGVVQGLSYWE